MVMGFVEVQTKAMVILKISPHLSRRIQKKSMHCWAMIMTVMKLMLSTGCNPNPLESCPFDSSSPLRFKKTSQVSRNSSVCYESMENITYEKIRTVVITLRGIIPDGDQLDSFSNFEEAVRKNRKLLKLESIKETWHVRLGYLDVAFDMVV
jgi:hypothetical protein